MNLWVLHLWIGSTKKNKSMEPHDCHFLVISNILYRVLTCISIWIGRVPASELSLISSKTFTLPPAHLCEEVDTGRLAYAAICDKSNCFGSALLFFFVEPIHRWSSHGFNFFLILKEFYTDMKYKHIFKKIYFLFSVAHCSETK